MGSERLAHMHTGLHRSLDRHRPAARLVRRVLDRARGAPDPRALQELGLRIGRGVYFAPGSVVDPFFAWLVTIEDGATLAPFAHVLAHDASTRRELGYTKLARVRIGRGAFVGARALVLPGVDVGDGAIVAAGSVVRRDVPPGTLVAGNPAEVVMPVAQYLARQEERMDGRPRWPRAGWTVPGGIDHEHREAMREALADGPGYVK